MAVVEQCNQGPLRSRSKLLWPFVAKYHIISGIETEFSMAPAAQIKALHSLAVTALLLSQFVEMLSGSAVNRSWSRSAHCLVELGG